jgi:hypothetical protein
VTWAPLLLDCDMHLPKSVAVGFRRRTPRASALGLDGLRNCAAAFLPMDARFTRGTAADLDAMAPWPEEDLRRSAVYALFSENEGRPGLGDEQISIPLLQIREMTDRQFDAAQAALTGTLTVIQGPPGTGKSDVVVSLLLSIFMARQTVLFASKNHQALDEVETRLSKLVGANPALTRGRDAEGDRDTNFLAAMKELSASEPRFGTSPPAIDDLVAAADVETSNRALRRTRAELEIELANLIERSLVLEPAGQPTGVTKLSFWRKVLNIASKWIRRPAVFSDGPIREDAHRCRQPGRTPRRCRQVTPDGLGQARHPVVGGGFIIRDGAGRRRVRDRGAASVSLSLWGRASAARARKRLSISKLSARSRGTPLSRTARVG